MKKKEMKAEVDTFAACSGLSALGRTGLREKKAVFLDVMPPAPKPAGENRGERLKHDRVE